MTRKPVDKCYRFAAHGIDLCPVCGSEVCIVGRTEDGRLIGSCGDAFTVAQWNDDEEGTR